jgi:anti-anti-sigma factor
MQLSTQMEGESLVVSVRERLDAVSTADFEASCARWIEEGSVHLVLDLSGLAYISSAGLRCILAAAKKARRLGGGLALCGLTGQVNEVIQLSGFDRILPTYFTADEALCAS